jgi:Phosphopantetheine attachment site
VYRKDFKVDSSRPQTDQSKGQGQLETKANPPTSMDAPTIRAMTKTDILNKLVADLSRVGGVSVDSIDVKAPLVHMLDSLTISQFKGMLENNYAVKLSDEYLFRESTTTTKLVEVVKLGHAPDDADGAKADAMAVQTGKARGLAGALGCPPGVVCVIM